MSNDRAWVLLPSSQRLDLLTPDPAAWKSCSSSNAAAGGRKATGPVLVRVGGGPW
jgi:hypothetical protein